MRLYPRIPFALAMGVCHDKSLKGYEGKPLCSECAAIEYDKDDKLVVVPGTWHGKFKKEWPTEEEKKHIGKNGILNM